MSKDNSTINAQTEEIIEKEAKVTNKSGKAKRILKELFLDAIYLLAVFCISFLLVKYVGQRTIVDGSSMESTLHDKDNLLINKAGYWFSDPKRFDIVVFPPSGDENSYYIKRVIGLPGETVQIELDGTILINGEPLEESYGREIISPDHIYRASEPILLGEDEYFVMGDNRNNSVDSRFPVVGNVKRDSIIGKAVFRIYPFSLFGKIE